MSQPTRSPKSRLVLPAACLVALGALLHACGGGGSSSDGGTPPAPSPGPGPTSFVSTFQFPSVSAVDVPVMPLVVLGFNDFVNPGTISATTVSLTQGMAAVPSTLTYQACNNRIQLVPTVPLAASTVYTISLTAGLLDDDGEALTPFTYTFTTIATTDATRPTMSAFAVTPNPGDETSQLQVTWTDANDNPNAPGTISYRVYVSAQPQCFDFSNPAAVTAQGVLQAVVMGLNSRTLYSVVVRAVDASGNESTNTAPMNSTTFTSLVQNVYPVVSGQCVGCHNPGGTATQAPYFINMNYSTPATVWNSWVGANAQCATAAANGFPTRVDPGDPNVSFLWNKISDPTPACGVQMPFGLPPLSAADQDIIFDWITEGALDN